MVHLAVAWGAAGEARPGPDEESKPGTAPTRAGALAQRVMEEVVDAANLRQALKRVRSNKGSPGVDGMTTQELSAYLKEAWPRLKEELLTGTYRPQPVKRVDIPKPGGGVRALGIPVSRSYCTSTQAAWGWCRGERVLPCQDTPWSGDARRAQRRRADLRSAVTTAGVKRTHQGPCGAVWIPSNRPSWHQAAIVETETFSSAAAARAE